MNFFKSVFSDDPDPQPESPPTNDPDPNPNPSPPELSPAATTTTATAGRGGAWKFGGLIKTLTSKSESIIETYRRDLQEFGTGLKKEIDVAHGSVGHVIDELGTTVAKGTAQIVSKSKDAILAADPESNSDHKNRCYSRFDAAVRAIQGDAGTYIEEPEDLEEYNEWKLGFSIDGKGEEMERLFRENEAMEGVYKKVVPNIVDHDGFWFRYYYKVYRMKKAEDVRNRIVRRISKEEEDLSWDVDDDDNADDNDDEGEAIQEVMIDKGVVGDENVGKRVDAELRVGGSGGGNEGVTMRLNVEEVHDFGEEGLKVEGSDNVLESKELDNKTIEELRVEESEGVRDEGGGGGRKENVEEAGVGEVSKLEVDNVASKDDDSAAELDEKVIMEKKGGDAKSCDRNNESSVVGTKHLAREEEKEEEEEEDLGWDEIEDLSSIDEKKVTQSGSSTSKVDLRKRLSAAEEEEDLSWDIDDDDEPAAKA